MMPLTISVLYVVEKSTRKKYLSLCHVPPAIPSYIDHAATLVLATCSLPNPHTSKIGLAIPVEKEICLSKMKMYKKYQK